MTHEYKHKIDLSQFENMECDCSYQHNKGMSVFAKCNMCGKEHNFDDEGLLAYARELEERIANMQEAGDWLYDISGILGLYWASANPPSMKQIQEAIDKWRNA